MEISYGCSRPIDNAGLLSIHVMPPQLRAFLLIRYPNALPTLHQQENFQLPFQDKFLYQLLDS